MSGQPIDPVPSLPARYVDAAFLARGGSGTVYRARTTDTHQVVAVKVLDSVRRLVERETAATERLDGVEGVVPLLDSGTLVDGRAFVVSEFFPLGSVADQVIGGRRYTPAEARTTGVRIARVLHTAHTAGVVHCDIKPSNLLIAADGSVDVADFGIARPLLSLGESSGTSTITFTLLYTPPSVLSGARPTPAADQYALALTLATMLLGRHPFAELAESGIAGLIDHIRDVGLPDLAPLGVPAELADVLHTAASVDETDRYPDCAAFADALEATGPRTGS